MAVDVAISQNIKNICHFPSNSFPYNYHADNLAFEKNILCKELLSSTSFIINRLTSDLTTGWLNSVIQRIKTFRKNDIDL